MAVSKLVVKFEGVVLMRADQNPDEAIQKLLEEFGVEDWLEPISYDRFEIDE
jgi:hypothetical protein